jgi:hypothetical protein
MKGVNLQIRISTETRRAIAALAPRSTSAFVRSAIEEKIRAERDRRLEKRWIDTLRRNPGGDRDDEAWFAAEAWDEP